MLAASPPTLEHINFPAYQSSKPWTPDRRKERNLGFHRVFLDLGNVVYNCIYTTAFIN